MENEVEIFRAWLSKYLKVDKVITGAELAKKIGIPSPRLSQYHSGRTDGGLRTFPTIPFDVREKILKAVDLPYEEVLKTGKRELKLRRLSEKYSSNDSALPNVNEANSAYKTTTKEEPIPFDPAVALLNECLKEAGAELNKKQKEAIVRIIRKYQNQAKEEVADIIEAFK